MPNLRLEKLKKIISQYPGWQGLLEVTHEIEEDFDTKPHISVGKAKALLESICRTILDRSSQEWSTAWDFPKLIKQTLLFLNVETVYNPNIRQALVLVTKSLNEARNTFDDRAHGHSLESNLSKLDSISNALIVTSTEAFSCFLIEFYEEHAGRAESFITAEEKQRFEDYLDEEYGDVFVAGIAYPTSEVLGAVDEIAYKDRYQDFKQLDELGNN